MIYYEVSHKYKLQNHIERKDIGIYSSIENAHKTVDNLKTKIGFCDHQNGFTVKRVFRLFKPKHLDKTFWIDGFDTYRY